MKYFICLLLVAFAVALFVILVGYAVHGAPWLCGEVRDGVVKLCEGPAL